MPHPGDSAAGPAPTTDDTTRVFGLRPALACFLLLALGTMLRLVWFDLMEFKYDEVAVIRLTRHWLSHGIPRYGMMSGVGIRNPPGFMFLLAPVVALTEDPLAIGFWIVLTHAAAAWVLYRAARGLALLRAGLWTAAFMAVHPWLILYARKIWAQSVLPLLVALVLLVLVRCARRARSGAVFWLGPLLSLIPQVHLSGVCLAPVIGGWGVVQIARRRLNVRMAAAGVLVGLLLLVPYVQYLAASGFADLGASGAVGGDATAGTALRTLGTWARMALAGGFGYPLTQGMAPLWRVLPGLTGRLLGLGALFGTIVVLGFAAAGSVGRRREEPDAPLRSFLLWPVLIALLPPLLYAARGLDAPPHYFILGLPALLLLAGIGADRLSRRHWSAALIGAVALLAGAAAWLGILDRVRVAGGSAGDYGTAYRHQLTAARHLQYLGVSHQRVDATLTRDRGIGILFLMQQARTERAPSATLRATLVNRLMFPEQARALASGDVPCSGVGPLVLCVHPPGGNTVNLKLQRAIDRIVGVPCCALLSLVRPLVPVRRATPPRKILVILLSEMGSLVLTLPLFERLRERTPDAEFHALVFARNREIVSLLGPVPEANIIPVRDTSLPALLGDAWRAMRAMRRARIDTVIDCELFSRVSSVFSFLSGAGTRVGFHRHKQEGLYRGSFINRPVPYNTYQHIADQFVTLAEAIDASGRPLVKRAVPAPPAELPAVALGPDEVASFHARLQRDFPAVDTRRLVLVNPGGGLLPIRAWPPAHYRRLCAALAGRGYTVGCTGMPNDRALAAEVLADCAESARLDLTGYTASVRELMALFHLAQLLVTNDGGPGHFASVTPISVIVLFGPETPRLYGPLSPRATALCAPLACSPCLTAYNHRNSACDGNNVCLQSITPETVLAEALALLDRRG